MSETTERSPYDREWLEKAMKTARAEHPSAQRLRDELKAYAFKKDEWQASAPRWRHAYNGEDRADTATMLDSWRR